MRVESRESRVEASRRLTDGRRRRSRPPNRNGGARSRLSLAPRSSLLAVRSGITLMEVLISMFVLLFGLMGVAAIFPVGNHYLIEGEKHDQGNALALNAFEEIRARGMLRPELWLYAGNPPGSKGVPLSSANHSYPSNFPLVIQDLFGVSPNTFNIPHPPTTTEPTGTGHAFVIDPLSSVGAGSPINRDVWPLHRADGGLNTATPSEWLNDDLSVSRVAMRDGGLRWPVRRLTLPVPNPGAAPAIRSFLPMDDGVAEIIFRLRDDLAVELPERDDFPAMLRWNVDSSNRLLTRQYQGNFSWLATIVPPTEQAHEGLQPALRQSYPYEVSVVVFYKRVPTPSAETERLLNAEMLPGGELVMYSNTIGEVDQALEEINSGDWVAVMGVNQQTRAFMLKWYRLLALDEEAYSDRVDSLNADRPLRRAMLLGPDWPATPDLNTSADFLPYVANLRVAILPGIASVVTREMVLERASQWNAN